MKKLLLFLIVLLFAATCAWAQTSYVYALGGSSGWYSDDTRDATGANLVGITLTHYGKPGQTPTAADDIVISQQISFVNGPGSIGALKMDKTSTSGGYSKCTMSKVNESGFATGDSWLNSFSCNYRYYTNSTAEVTIPKIGVQSTVWAASQSGFTAQRSGESVWDLILVDWRGTDPGWTVGSWATFNTDKNTVCWRIYRQAGNSYHPATPGVSLSLQQIKDDATWGPLIFGTGAKVTSFQLGVGSSAQASTSYIDYIETNLLNGGNRVDFDAPPPTPETTIETPTAVSCGVYDVDVTVQDFTNVGAISLVLNFDPLILSYQSVSLNSAISGASANIASPGKFILGDFPIPAVTLADDDVLFTLHFQLANVCPGTDFDLVWSVVPGECEYAGPLGTPVYVSSFFDVFFDIPAETTPPVISTCPPSKTLDGCDVSAITPLAYSETSVSVTLTQFTAEGGVATDACGGVTTWSYKDSKTGTCPIVVTRVWTVGDACGNTITCNQTITVQDLTPPDWGAPIFRRDMPLANVNNAAGANRSNVAWADGALSTEYYGDDFKLGFSADGYWTINKVVVWGVAGDVTDPNFELEDYFNDISLYAANAPKDPWTAPFDWSAPQGTVQMNTISTGTFLPNSNSTNNPYISIVEVKYYNGESYQRGSGAFRRIWQVTFDNLNWTVPAGQLITYGVNCTHKFTGSTPEDIAKRWFNHFSNYEKSLGSTPPWTLWDGLNLDFSPVPAPLTDIYAIDNSLPGQGWDKQNDHNVLIYGVASCDLAFNGCLLDAPAGPTIGDIALLFEDNCGGPITVTKFTETTGNDCDWNVKYSYMVEDVCGNIKVPWPTVNYHGYNQDPPAEVGGPVPIVGLLPVECETAPTPPAILPVVQNACGTVLLPTWDSPVIQPTNTTTRVENFTSGVTLSPTAAPGKWYVDRYAPAGFGTSFFDGDFRLKESVDPTGPTSGFYRTQGRKYNVGVNSVEIKLYIPADWELTNKRMAGLWGTAVDANYVVSGYPIVEFTSDGNDPRFQAYETGTGAWIDMGLPVGFLYDCWVTLSIQLLPSGEFHYTVVTPYGTLNSETTTGAPSASVRLNNVILQGINAGTTYDIYWDDFTGVMCEGTVAYIYRYEDCKANANDEIYNQFNWTYTYTVDHVTPPAEVGGPVEFAKTVECAASATAPTLLPVVADVCGVILSPVAGPVQNKLGTDTYAGCEGTISYTWTYTDCAGLSYDWVYTYTVDHTIAPVVPPNAGKTVSCPVDAVAPTLLSTVPDQQQLLHATSGFTQLYWIDFTSIGQSFTCGTSGWLTQIDLKVGSLAAPQNFTLQIFQGNGIAGTLLYSGSHSISALGWQSLTIAQNVAPYLTAGQQYTFWLTSFGYNQLGLAFMSPDAYTGGVSMDGCTAGCSPTYAWQQWPAYDLTFKTYMTVMPVVTDVCSTVIPTPTPVITYAPDPLVCEGTKTYTYTYVDCSGLASNWVYTYTIEREDFTMPANAGSTVECIASATQPTPPAVNDNCGNAITPTGPTIGGTYVDCEGTRTYTWTYKDCELNTHNWVYTYTIDDITPPTITCPVDITVHMNTGCTATGVNLGTPITGDNCNGTLTITNDAPPAFPEFTTIVTWKVKDCAGNEATCTQIVTVVRNTFTGTLKYYKQTPAIAPYPEGSMDMTLTSTTLSPLVSIPFTTGSNGIYTFSGLCADTYTLSVTTTKAAGGINSTDAAQVNAWNVTGQPSGPWPTIEKVKFFAGDAVVDNNLNSGDAGRILQYFVQAGNPAFGTYKWKFWWAGETTTTNPTVATPISVVVAADVSKDLYGLCTGDWNGSYTLGKDGTESLTLNYGQTMQVQPGTEFELPLVAGMDMEVGAVSLILNFPSDNVEITGVFLSSDPNSPLLYNVSGDELRIGWNTLAPVWLNEGESLITLKMKVNDPTANGSIYFSLAGDPLNELADKNYEVIGNAVLTIDVVKTSALGFGENSLAENLTLSNHPNPFNGTTTFVYSLPVDGKVILEIFDLVGNKVKVAVDETQSAGTYSLKLDANQLQPGVYTATLKLKNTGTAITRTIKIISK